MLTWAVLGEMMGLELTTLLAKPDRAGSRPAQTMNGAGYGRQGEARPGAACLAGMSHRPAAGDRWGI
jgi:hypothetical protein